MTGGRGAGPAAVLAAFVAGLAWAPTFAPAALAPLVAAVLAPVLLADQLTFRRPRLAGVRPVLGLLGGAAALVAVLVLARGATPAEVLDGLVNGWQRTLASTLPAWPDADQVAFVPALVLVAGVLGVEWARHSGAAPAVLLPSFAVLVLAQLFHAAQGWTATATAAGYALAVAAVLAAGRRGPVGRAPGRRLPALLSAVALLVPILALVGAGTWAGSAMMSGRPAYSMQDGRTVPPPGAPAADPLSEIGERLAAGDRVAFRVRTGAAVDRWPLVVLDTFDGVDWGSSGQVRILGTELDGPGPALPATTAEAEVSDVALEGPWLPSRPRLRAVTGLRALVDPATGVLLRADAQAPTAYRLRWDDLRVDRDQLAAATIDPAPVGSVELAEVPAGVAELARAAVGPGAAPSVQSALVLERWMRDNYAVAEGADIPTGHGYPQLLHFLTTSRRGTSEQFATAYAVMARSIGIPTRVVVGFRDDGTGTVHDRDVLAWPEIAVSGLGWLPLDPTGGARTGTGGDDGLAAATEAARADLPGPGPVPPPAAAEVVPAPVADGSGLPWWPLPVLLLAGLVAVPLAKAVRRTRRRRGPPRDAVRGAWLEVRDALRDQGAAVPAGATVRDLGDLGDVSDVGDVGAPAPVDPADLAELARCVDVVLWSGGDAGGTGGGAAGAAGRAWAVAGRVRRALRGRSVRSRLRSGYALASLRKQPDRVQPPQSAPLSG